MSYATATFSDAIAFDRRVLAAGRPRSAVVSGVAVGVGTVTAAGATTGAVAVIAAWMMAASFAANPHLSAGTSVGLGTATLTQHYSVLASAADFSGWARILAPSAEASDPTADAELTTATLTAAEQPASTAVTPAEPAPIEPTTVAIPAATHSGVLASAQADSFSLLTPHSFAGPQTQPEQDSPHPAAGPAKPQVTAALSPPSAPASPDLLQKRVAVPPTRNDSNVLPGPDSHTAVYDIEAHTVYLPSGLKLEAHSGLGNRLDDPHFIKEKDRGPTPPNVYDLTWRGELFHGVRAIRLNPVDDGKMFGRDGILAHTYMLGPSGQSFGCVSFKNYSAFQQAFTRGEVDRLIVVPHLGAKPLGDQRARIGDIDRFASTMR